ncbi:Metallo-dependent phosphatase [Piromyces finnis]|uniref:Metallo-dependent phosphatase n=1 Tax=Piromyces finnis TaxID=1754191 RepID=A0A1Y1VMF5_9FUNG|nr:Metallo-dependent phosphatase [Piromyces finnis]|eukprot:ORX60088.1 Metallo-dependent phosphatase [Piromyces finnis]
MNKKWVLYTTIAAYVLSLFQFLIFRSGLNSKTKNNLGNYEDIININDKKNYNKNYNNEVIDNKPTNIFYFIQISDLHISELYKIGTFSHLKFLVENLLPVISPRFVFVTGDIVDSAANNFVQSKQKEREWKAYNTLVTQSEYFKKHNESSWFDLRGNHDSFNTPDFDHEANLYKNYSITKKDSFHISYVTDYGSYTFNSIDATPRHGPSSPYNLFGTVDREKIDRIANIYDFAKSNNHKHIFSFSHYPSNTINVAKTSDNRTWNDLSKQISLYLSGHLHDLKYNLFLYSHHRNFIELELKDMKIHGTYRIIAVDHDVISFADNVLQMPNIPYVNPKDYGLEDLLKQPKFNMPINPIVLITNPQDTQITLSDNHFPTINPKKLTHVRTLIFSESPIKSISLYIDGEKVSTVDSLSNQNSSFKLIGNDNLKSDEYLPLYAMEWAGNESYNDGKSHVMIVKAIDSNDLVGENTIHFNFNHKQENFRIDIFSRNALRFYLPALIPLTCAGLIILYHIVLAVIPFMYVHNHSSTEVQYNSVEQYEMNSYNDNVSSITSHDSDYSIDKVMMPKKKKFIYRFIIKPFISFASNPYLFYPYHFFYIYYLIGPQLFGNLMDKGKTFKERFVIVFLHGVYANGERVNYSDAYFYIFKELLVQQTILFLIIVYLNHCKCRQCIITIFVHLYLIYFCIKSHSRTFYSYNPLILLLTPFYSWFMVWEILTILTLLTKNFLKYPSGCKKIFKQR